MKKISLIIIFLCIMGGFNFYLAAEKTNIGSHIFGELLARSIGPAAMSGRISALDVVLDNPNIF